MASKKSFIAKALAESEETNRPVDQTKFDDKKWQGYMRDHEEDPKSIPEPKTVRYPTDGVDCVVLRNGLRKNPRYAKVECKSCSSILQTRTFAKGVLFIWFHCPVCHTIGKQKQTDTVYIKN